MDQHKITDKLRINYDKIEILCFYIACIYKLAMPNEKCISYPNNAKITFLNYILTVQNMRYMYVFNTAK